jgi:hypothetical protein
VLGEAVAGGTNATITLQWPLALELSGFTFRRAGWRNTCQIPGITVFAPLRLHNPYSISGQHHFFINIAVSIRVLQVYLAIC